MIKIHNKHSNLLYYFSFLDFQKYTTNTVILFSNLHNNKHN